MDNFDMAVAVKNGDAISRSELIKQIRLMASRTSLGETRPDDISGIEVCGLILNAPALDVAPVVYGEFERLPEEVIPNFRATPVLCKTCNTTFITLNKEGKKCMCCPYCGARLDGEAE